MRQKWEKEEEDAMNKPVGSVHYQDTRFSGKYHFYNLISCCCRQIIVHGIMNGVTRTLNFVMTKAQLKCYSFFNRHFYFKLRIK